MQRIVVLLLVILTALTAAGIFYKNNVMERRRSDDSITSWPITDPIQSMSGFEVIRQQFLLDILQYIGQPLMKQELLELGTTLIVDNEKYVEGINDEMLHIIKLYRDQRLLGKEQTYTIANEEHVRQMIGLYRMFVRSADWDTFQRNVCFARAHMNGVLFVNALLLALRDHDDTRMLIVPAINEILPILYYNDEIQYYVNATEKKFLTARDKEAARSWTRHDQPNDEAPIVYRSQLWHEWYMEMAARKGMDYNMRSENMRNDNMILLAVYQYQTAGDSRLAMFTGDIALNTFLHGLVNDMLLREGDIRQMGRSKDNTVDREQIGRVSIEKNVGTMLERVRQVLDNAKFNDNEDNEIRIRGGDVDMREQVTNSGRRIMYAENRIDDGESKKDRHGKRDSLHQSSVDSDRLLYVGRRHRMLPEPTDNSLDQERDTGLNTNRKPVGQILRSNNVHDGRRVLSDMDQQGGQQRQEKVMDRNDDVGDRRRWKGIDQDKERDLDEDRDMQMRNKEKMGRREGVDNRRIDVTDIDGDLSMKRGRMNKQVHQSKVINRNRDLDMDTDVTSGRIADDDRVGGRLSQTMDGGIDRNEEESERGISYRNADSDRLLNPSQQRPNLKPNNKGRYKYAMYTRLMEMLRKVQPLDDTYGELHLDIDEESKFWNDMDTMYGEDNDNDMSRMRKNKRQVNDNSDRMLMRGMEDIGTVHDKQRLRDPAMDPMSHRNMVDDRQQSPDMPDSDEETDEDDSRWPRPRISGKEMVNTNRRIVDLVRSGELVLHTLQQLMARISMERLSLGLPDIEDEINQKRLDELANSAEQQWLNYLGLDSEDWPMMLERISEMERRLAAAIEQEIQRSMQAGGPTDIDGIIADVLLGKVEGVGILTIMREMILQMEFMYFDKPLMNAGIFIDDSMMQYLLRRIVKLVDVQRNRQLGRYKREDVLMNGITIDDVTVDKLRTFVDDADADLINLMDAGYQLEIDSLRKTVMGRQIRLNHKSFTIKVHLKSDRCQRVVMRMMLGPKVDINGRPIDLNEQRLNFVLLDTSVVELHIGHNAITRKSKDIVWANRDVTPYTEIYQRVMMMKRGSRDLNLQPTIGQDCRFPHHLLLPRGRVEGLPMQLLVLVTPIKDDYRLLQQNIRGVQMCGMGVGNVKLDNLPVGFPLDRNIDDVQELLTLPNLHLQDVMIYHKNTSEWLSQMTMAESDY